MNKRSAALLFVAALMFSSIPFIGVAQTAAPKPQCSLKASTYALQKGNTVNLTWSSTNAVSGSITSIGPVAPQGVQGVIPTKTTTYTGTFTGPGGSVKCVVTVAVVMPPGSTGSGAVGGVGAEGELVGMDGQMTPGTGIVQVDSVPASTATDSLNRLPSGGIVPCNGVLCQMCDLVKLSQNIINFLIGLSIPLAAALFAWAGVLFFTSSAVDKIAKARSILTNALIGFLIAISAWLVVQTLMKAILSDDFYKGWNRIECVADSQRQTKGTVAQLLGSVLPGLNTGALTPGSPLVAYNPTGCAAGTTNFGGQCYEDVSGIPVGPAVNNNQGYNPSLNSDGCFAGSTNIDGQCIDNELGVSVGTPNLSRVPTACPNGYQYEQRFDEGEDLGLCFNPDTGDIADPTLRPAGNTGAGTQQWVAQLQAACANSGVQDCALAQAIMANESSGNPRAISPAGAIGLMQVLPTTACGMDSSIPGCGTCTVNNPRGGRNDNLNGNCAAVANAILDPSLNMTLGTRYITQLARNPNINGDPALIAAGYNGGPLAAAPANSCNGRVYQCEVNIGYRETRIYVPKVLNTYNQLR
jgi:hypothetical protein